LAVDSRKDLSVVDTATGKTMQTLKDPFPLNSLLYLPKEDILASANDDRTVRLWRRDAEGHVNGPGELVGQHLESVLYLAASPDGKTLASAANDGTIKLWDLTLTPEQAQAKSTREFQIRRTPTHAVWSLSFSADGSALFG